MCAYSLSDDLCSALKSCICETLGNRGLPNTQLISYALHTVRSTVHNNMCNTISIYVGIVLHHITTH